VRRWQRWAVAGLAGITIEFAKVCDDKPKCRMFALTNPDTPAKFIYSAIKIARLAEKIVKGLKSPNGTHSNRILLPQRINTIGNNDPIVISIARA
jgi:hypothetical protein